MLGGPSSPGFGFAIGQDRLMLAVEHAGNLKGENSIAAYVAWLGDGAFRPAAELARGLRQQGWRVEIGYEPVKLSKSLSVANKLHARYAIIIGEGELASGRYQIKDMGTRSEERRVGKECRSRWSPYH